MRQLLIMAILVGLIAHPSARAEVPSLIRYQGQAVDANGVPLEGPYTLKFRLYNAETAGTIVWEETQTNVPLSKGHFSVLLGSGTVLTGVDWAQPCWLSVQVNGEPELAPRQRITSVPLALRAKSAEQLTEAITPSLITPQGSGSGLDADMVDGKDSTAFVKNGDAAGGDLSGTYPTPTVSKINGKTILPILSVNQASTSSPTSIGAGWTNISGLSVTVAPKSSASRFLIYASAGSACQAGGCGSSGEWALRLMRNGTTLQTLVSDEGGAEGRSAMHPMTFTYLDAPATAAAVTFTVQGRAANSGVFAVPGRASAMGEQSTAVITIIEFE